MTRGSIQITNMLASCLQAQESQLLSLSNQSGNQVVKKGNLKPEAKNGMVW